MSKPFAPSTVELRTHAIHHAAHSALEDLEARQMLANDPLATGTYSNGGAWLNVLGSANDDSIVVSQPAKGTYTISNGTWSITKNGTFVGVRVAAGAGNDSVSINTSLAFRAWLLGEAGNDTLTGGALNDVLSGGTGDDSLDGGLGNDTLTGEAGNDVLVGNDGADSLNGGADNDTLFGGAGNDTLDGSTGNDAIDGGIDNDRLIGDLGTDVYVGGDGLDILDYTGRTMSLNITVDGVANDGASGENDNVGSDLETIVGGNASDTITNNDTARALYGGTGNDTINGGAANDKLYGGAGADVLNGNGGDDSLYGQADADQLNGGDGDDFLEGGAGNDALNGGAGNDELIAVGGGTGDSLAGGDGLDSYWLDSDATEKLMDVSDAETLARAVHRVKAFLNAGKTAVSKDLLGQNLVDPVGVGKIVNFKASPLFGTSGPGEDDIGQGQAGDCWFMSGISAIAKTMPETIRQSITSLGDGTFAVRFGTGNAEKYVRVDADLYTYTWSNTVQSYARSGSGGSIWAPILEKALTWVRGGKLGNYATINGGWMDETNSYFGLTNADFWKSNTSNVSGMIDWLKQQLDAGKAVTMGTGGVAAGSGLVGGHAYAVDHVTTNNDGTVTVTVRNPWGSDGSGFNDGANDGYVTLTAGALYANFGGLTAAA